MDKHGSQQSFPEAVFIALGSNISPELNLPKAVIHLRSCEQLEVLKVSSVWESAPVGYLEQAVFCNTSVLVKTNLTPKSLKSTLLDIEEQLGRERDPSNKNGPRTIDLDIALFGGKIVNEPGLIIPDPDIESLPFIALPLAELFPEFVHPVLEITLAEIAGRFDQCHQMKLRDDIDRLLLNHPY